VFFFKESLIYPFVMFEDKSRKLFIRNEIIVEILAHIEDNGFVAI